MWECHCLWSTHIVRVYSFVFIAWQLLVSVYQNPCLHLKKRMFVVSNPTLRYENAIDYNPHKLLRVIFFIFIAWQLHVSVYQNPGLYLKKSIFVVSNPILRCEDVIVYDPHQSTHIVRVYFFVFIAWQLLFTNIHACIFKKHVCGKLHIFTM